MERVATTQPSPHTNLVRLLHSLSVACSLKQEKVLQSELQEASLQLVLDLRHIYLPIIVWLIGFGFFVVICAGQKETTVDYWQVNTCHKSKINCKATSLQLCANNFPQNKGDDHLVNSLPSQSQKSLFSLPRQREPTCSFLPSPSLRCDCQRQERGVTFFLPIDLQMLCHRQFSASYYGYNTTTCFRFYSSCQCCLHRRFSFYILCYILILSCNVDSIFGFNFFWFFTPT